MAFLQLLLHLVLPLPFLRFFLHVLAAFFFSEHSSACSPEPQQASLPAFLHALEHLVLHFLAAFALSVHCSRSSSSSSRRAG